MDVGRRIKERREALGMSQEELAKKVGYTSRTTINKIENGANNLRQTKIAEFAKALNCEPADLMGWTVEDMFAGLSTFVMATADEQRILDSYRKADDQTKEMVRRILKG